MRRALFALSFALAVVAFAQWAEDDCGRAGGRCRDTRMGRLVAAVSSAATWSGPWFGFAMADSGVGGIPRGLTAACACQPVYGVTADGDAGVLLALTRNTVAYCTKTQGATPQAIAVGDMVLCDGGLPAIMYGAGVNAPLGLLVEAAGTNLMLRSDQFTDPAWVHFTEGDGGDVTHTADLSLSPSGTLTADHVTWQATGPTDSSGIRQDSLTAVAYSGSVYSMGLAGDAGSFDIAVQTAGAYLCRDCTYVANAYTRCELPNVTSKTAGMFLMGNLSSICDGGTHVAQTVALWGAQVEAGANVTSYIPTTSASATRNATVASFTVGAIASAASVSARLQSSVAAAANQGLVTLAPSLGGTPTLLMYFNSALTCYAPTRTPMAIVSSTAWTTGQRAACWIDSTVSGARVHDTENYSDGGVIGSATVIVLGAQVTAPVYRNGVISDVCVSTSAAVCR